MRPGKGCVYSLTAELPRIYSTIVVNGNGAAITRAATAPAFRILTVDGGNLTLRALTITRGDATGSPIQTGAGGSVVVTGNGTLNANAVVIQGNRADFGGGVSTFSGSTTTINASVVAGNTAGSDGGGIANIGQLTVRASNIRSNEANTGGGIANGVPGVPGGTSTISISNISNNTAHGNNPGGIYNNGGTVNLTLSTVIDNTPNNCATSPTPVSGCFN
ncbi:hypothetical protein [Streptomyces sp. NPDC001494]